MMTLGVYLGAPIISERRKGEEKHPLSSGPTSAWRQPSLSADLQVHHLVSEGSGGNLGNVSRPGSLGTT